MDFNIDPEAGIPAGSNVGIGNVEGPGMGSGEGFYYGGGGFNSFDPNLYNQPGGGGGKRKQLPQMGRMDYYQQLGQQLRSALQEPQQEPQGGGGLTGGFDMNWLMNQTNAGSANGAHL